MAGSSIFKGGNSKYNYNIRNLRNSWRISENKNFFKGILLKTAIYDLYISKNNSKILVTPNDPWPGDASIGDGIFQGDFNLSSTNRELLSQKLLWKINNNKEFWIEEIHTFSWLRHLKARSGPLAREACEKTDIGLA